MEPRTKTINRLRTNTLILSSFTRQMCLHFATATSRCRPRATTSSLTPCAWVHFQYSGHTSSRGGSRWPLLSSTSAMRLSRCWLLRNGSAVICTSTKPYLNWRAVTWSAYLRMGKSRTSLSDSRKYHAPKLCTLSCWRKWSVEISARVTLSLRFINSFHRETIQKTEFLYYHIEYFLIKFYL